MAIRATNKAVKERIKVLYGVEVREQQKEDDLTDWLDYASGVMDMYEVIRNEFLAEYRLPAKNRMFYKDIILPFCTNTLLTDNIAAGEDIKYKNENHNHLKIKVFHKGELKATYENLVAYGNNNDTCVSYPDNFPYLVKTKNLNVDLDTAFNSKKIEGEDIEVCIASEHSIYSILENFIRNSAKHNKKEFEQNNSKNLEIFVKITEHKDDYYYCYLYDNVSRVTKKSLQGFEKRLSEDFFDGQGQLIKANLGIADMKINAHLLQSAADISKENLRSALEILACDCPIENDPTDWKELNAFLSTIPDAKKEEIDSQTKKYRFAYRFKLSKPKKVVWIGNNQDAAQWNKIGITLYKEVKDFTNQDSNRLAAYQFAILETEAVKDLDEQTLEQLLLKLPFRVLLNCTALEDPNNSALKTLSENRRIQIVENKVTLPHSPENSFELVQNCWEQWLKRWLTMSEKGVGKAKAHLYIYLEDSKPITEWKKTVFNNNLFEVSFLSPSPNHSYTRTGTESNEFIVFYDHHGYGFEKCSGLSLSNSLSDGSYFQFDKASEDYVTFFYPPDNENHKKQILFEAIEAGLMNIAILDERLVDILKVTEDPNITKIHKDNGFFSKEQNVGNHADLLNIGKTFFITSIKELKVIDEHKPSTTVTQNEEQVEVESLTTATQNLILTQNKGQIEVGIEYPNHLNNQRLKFDGLIIHRTYLSKLLPDANDKKTEWMKALNAQFKQVVVISGGGYPHSLNFNVHYQPFSSVQRNFAKYQSKMSLIKLF
ncbi:MAG: hypothetical protein U0Y10_04560 [Spirosomataceae bacterium]